MKGGKTAESTNGDDAPPSSRKPRLWLMQVERKLPFRLNARRPPAPPRRSTKCPWSTARGERMDSYKVVISPSTKWTRILVSHGPDEILRAILPSPAEVRHSRAASTFLEALSLWLDRTLPVVLSVDARDSGFCLGLTDEMGVGMRSVYYRVEVSERGPHRRRGTRIQGVGDFSDLRQLRLVSDDGER
jgi:hypothetical protein